MQITGTGALPLHIARAYGIKPGAQLQLPQKSAASLGASNVDASGANSAKQLVAGSVSHPVSFDAPAQTAPVAPAGTFQMYTRAADKIEAAVAVQVGRLIDFTG